MAKSRNRIFGEGGWVEVYDDSPVGQTEVEILNLPEWVSEIIILTNKISPNANSNRLSVQLGTSGGYVNTGHEGTWSYGVTNGNWPIDLALLSAWSNQVNSQHGECKLTKGPDNGWTLTGLITAYDSGNEICITTGHIPAGGAIDRIRVFFDAGAQFDAGDMKILYR